MTITKLGACPRLSWWHRLVRRIAGGQDLLVVVTRVVTHSGTVTDVSWFMGVDMRRPLVTDIGEDTITISLDGGTPRDP